MVTINDLKPGDMVYVTHDGEQLEGTVVSVARDQNMVCVDNGVQEFWYPVQELISIPLNEEQLLRLGFQRQDEERGIKYMKGPFRILIHEEGRFSDFEIWYREDHRRFHRPLTLHELQNHYYDMTKVHLEAPVRAQ